MYFETYDEFLSWEYEKDNIEELHDAMADVADDANQRELDERSSDED